MIYLVRDELFEHEKFQTASVEDCISYFEDKNIIEVDTETEYNKRNPKHLPNPYEHKVLCLQLGDKDNQFVFDLEYTNISKLKILFEDPTKIKIFCNSFFDLRFIFHWRFNIVNIYDIFLAEMLLTLGMKKPKGYRGLAGMSERYLGEKLDKEVRGQIHWRGLDEKVIIYAAGDVCKMNLIREKQLIEISKYNLLNALDLENLFAIILAKISYNGFKINQLKWLEVYNLNKEKSLKQLHLLNQYIIDNKMYDYFTENLFGEFEVNINWDSPTQVVKLFKKIGINTEIPDKEKGGVKQSVDGKHLTRQKRKFEILPIYLTYKEIKKEISTYGEDFLKQNINPKTGRVHSEFFQLVDTGRISSSNPNCQNIPATDENGETNPLRECFIADESNVLIVSDYSQQEPRITAEYSQDPYLIDFIINGDGDSHSLVSSAISEYLLGEPVKVSKSNNPFVDKYNMKIRDIGKMINLGLDYGKTAFSVKEDLSTTQEEAQKLIDLLKSKTPKKEEYFKRQINFVKNNGYVVIDKISNRRSYFKDYEEYKKLQDIPYEHRTKQENRNYSKIRGSLERFAMNYPIQGTGGSMTKLAAIYFSREVGNLSDIKIVALVHDEIVVECSKEKASDISKILQDCMERAGNVFCKTIPLKAEPKITPTWQK